jgi:hypothetical protein
MLIVAIALYNYCTGYTVIKKALRVGIGWV